MTKAMPFLQKAILLSYDPRRFAAACFFPHDNGFDFCSARIILNQPL